MKRFALVAIAASIAMAQQASAQWANVADPALKRTKSGEVDLTGPAPMKRGKPDFRGVWLPDREPLPPQITTVEGNIPFPHNFFNVMADVKEGGAQMRPETAAALQRKLALGGAGESAAHCMPTGMPILATGILPFKVVQADSEIVILYEENTVFRQIFLDGRKTVEDPEPRWLGYSSGKWDGNELVVETVGFNDRGYLDAMGHSHSDKLRLTERIRRKDAGHLETQVTIDDPTAYTKPIVYTIKSTLRPDEDLLEYFCADNEKDVQHFQ
jgi:hypothetical protein